MSDATATSAVKALARRPQHDAQTLDPSVHTCGPAATNTLAPVETAEQRRRRAAPGCAPAHLRAATWPPAGTPTERVQANGSAATDTRPPAAVTDDDEDDGPPGLTLSDSGEDDMPGLEEASSGSSSGNNGDTDSDGPPGLDDDDVRCRAPAEALGPRDCWAHAHLAAARAALHAVRRRSARRAHVCSTAGCRAE